MAPNAKSPEPKDLLVRADSAAAQEETFRHPLNPASELRGTTLSRLTGLTKCGVNVIRIPPGKESFVHHVHLVDEEWMYVLSGMGELRIGDERFAVGPGDFAGFPPRTHAHHLRNTGTEELVYLSGGEAVDFGVADMPDLGVRLVHVGNEAKVYPIAAGKDLFGK
ncbi:MAG: cupin domain-containing protein [Anaeromyxobacteraceae bacterium]